MNHPRRLACRILGHKPAVSAGYEFLWIHGALRDVPVHWERYCRRCGAGARRPYMKPAVQEMLRRMAP